jgi:hypothetical protein
MNGSNRRGDVLSAVHRVARVVFKAVVVLFLPVLVPAELWAEGATPEVRMRGEYPANLIYGFAQMGSMGCPGDNRPDCVTPLMREMHGYGLRATRKGVSWFDCEPERGAPYVWDGLDSYVPYVTAEGFTIVALITGTPVWASHPKAREILHEEGRDRFVGCLQNEPEYWPDYERWLRAMLERYGPLLDYYEIWNEPDGMCGLYPKYWEGHVGGVGVGGDPEWYAELLRRTTPIIREMDPGAKVSVGGFERKAELQTDFVEGIYEHGAQPYFDAIAIHPYGDPYRQPFDRKWLATVREVMAKHGDERKPFWITEYNNEGRDELDMSFTVRRKHRLIRETLWITIAIPLGTQYMYYGKNALNWPLRAIKQMEATEFEARKEWEQDFEASVTELLPNWEWRAEAVQDPNRPKISIEPDEGRELSKALWVEGYPSNKVIRVYFLPYIRSEDPKIELWFAVIHQKENTSVVVQVGVECLDILQPVRLSDFVASVTDQNEYRKLEFRVADHWPDWEDQGINMFWVQFSCPDPGYSISIDDVYVH